MKSWLRISLVASLSCFALATAIETASATRYQVTFKGTRDQVRKACASGGGDPLEGANYTSCTNLKNGNEVSCDDKGKCTGTYTATMVKHDWNGAAAPTVGLLMSH